MPPPQRLPKGSNSIHASLTFQDLFQRQAGGRGQMWWLTPVSLGSGMQWQEDHKFKANFENLSQRMWWNLPSTHKCLGSVTSTTENKSKTETKTNKAKHGSIHDTEPCILFAYKLRIQSANEAMVCCKLSSSAPLCPESSGL